MIISASRRTDIPAFFAGWFMEKIRSGAVQVSNPFNPRQIRTVSLRPEDVDGIVFWSKNPAPFLENLDAIARAQGRTPEIAHQELERLTHASLTLME